MAHLKAGNGLGKPRCFHRHSSKHTYEIMPLGRVDAGWPQSVRMTSSELRCALQFYETGLVDPKLWPFGDDLRERFEMTRVSRLASF